MNRTIVHSLILVISLLVVQSCSNNKGLDSAAKQEGLTDSSAYQLPRALLASRFPSLDSLTTVVQLDFKDAHEDSTKFGVIMGYADNGVTIHSDLSYGITQGDILEVRDGDIWDKVLLIGASPFSVSNRVDLNRIYKLARRRPTLFGEGDVAFYDMAEISVQNINTADLAFPLAKDSSEKGYINTFNHVTAQALITTLFSEELADFVADVHERYHMPELLTGKFKPDQLLDVDNNPVDNYVDIINNELGQALGLALRKRYNINTSTQWTPHLLADYLNDLQRYYCWSFGIGMLPVQPDDERVVRFATKINEVGLDIPYGMHK